MSDRDIADRVVRALEQREDLRGAVLQVEVDRGVVTLTGTLDGYGARWAAREAAYGVAGVLEVVNRTTVVLRSTPLS